MIFFQNFDFWYKNLIHVRLYVKSTMNVKILKNNFFHYFQIYFTSEYLRLAASTQWRSTYKQLLHSKLLVKYI